MKTLSYFWFFSFLKVSVAYKLKWEILPIKIVFVFLVLISVSNCFERGMITLGTQVNLQCQLFRFFKLLSHFLNFWTVSYGESICVNGTLTLNIWLSVFISSSIQALKYQILVDSNTNGNTKNQRNNLSVVRVKQ